MAELSKAERPRATEFPRTAGSTLQQIAATARPGAALGAATGTFTPGEGRLAFALNAPSGAFIYAPTAVYLARGPHAPAQGPYLARGDPLTVPPAFRSRQNSGPGGIQAIYEAQVPLPAAGTYTVLSMTLTSQGFIGAQGEIAVAASSPIPGVGQRPPAIATDTAASVHGNLSLLTTRVPAEDMHSASLAKLLGRRPVALLVSTPQLCISRVCGPVTDIAVLLQQRFGQRITFIHQEVYVNNQPSQGLRPPLKAFNLRTEPWLFTIDRHGRIAARLEGSFGVDAFTAALQAALR
ncbi:MAG: hypothetical protein M3Z27_09485 [Actinomycetota bacterium]|nr:hypothetical protein [Actinomycetota bacterium]